MFNGFTYIQQSVKQYGNSQFMKESLLKKVWGNVAKGWNVHYEQFPILPESFQKSYGTDTCVCGKGLNITGITLFHVQ